MRERERTDWSIKGFSLATGNVHHLNDMMAQPGLPSYPASKGAITWLGTSGKTAARELQGAATRHAGICQGMMRGMLRGIPRNQGQGFVSQDEGTYKSE